MTSVPRVGVVVLNRDGGDLTMECLHSLERTEWPASRLELVLVDNASNDGVVARVKAELPAVRIVENPKNLGFAGGCNVGIRAVSSATERIALVNNDATVDPGWLRPLAEVLDADSMIGAACPKILFAGRFGELSIRSATRRGPGDRRDLGVRVTGARVSGADVWRRAQLVHGFWGPEPTSDRSEDPGQWTTSEAILRLPVTSDGLNAQLRLAAVAPTVATVSSGGHSCEIAVVGSPAWFDVPLMGPELTIVNNVGSMLTADGYAIDRGYLEPDDGQFDRSDDVFAWCGAAVLLTRAYLDDVGHFDERLFLYYEDFELSWRGRERGWKHRYVPTSVVHHVHAATSVEGSALKDYYNERNRLLVLTRHTSRRDLVRRLIRYLLVTASYARRDVLRPLLHGEPPRGSIVRRRLRAFGGYLRRAPSVALFPDD